MCKVAKFKGEDGIIEQDYSLNAGRYVGIIIEDDGVTEEEFSELIKTYNVEFNELCDKAKAIEKDINGSISRLIGD